MDDISGRRTKHTTQDEALFPDLKEEHENHPKTAHEDANETKTKKGHPHTLWQRWRAGTIHNQLTVLFTVLIFLATSAYAIFSGYQLSVMKQQVAEMKSGSTDTHELAVQAKNQADRTKNVADNALIQVNATNSLAKEAKRSADVARDSLEITRKALRLDQRAWVGQTKMQVDITEGQPFAFRMEIKNVGKTPALHLQAHTNWAFFDSKQGVDDGHFVTWIPSDEQALQPGAENDIIVKSDDFILTPERISLLKNGKMWLWVRTEIRYADIFNERHKTVICGIVNQADLKTINACPPGNQEAN